MDKKKCSKCPNTKPLSDFSLSYGKPRSYCKDCGKLMKSKWTAKNKTHISKENKKRYTDNSQEIKDKQKKYYSNNKEYYAEYAKVYNREYYQNNKAEIRQNQSQYRKDNIDIIREQQRHYQSENLDIFRANNSKRRAIKKGVSEKFSSSDRLTTMVWFNRECYKCKSTDQLQIDHHEPLKNNNPLCHGNAVVLCSVCNAKKGSLSPSIFYTESELVNITAFLSVLRSL